MWPTENPWPLAFVFLVAGVGLAIAWVHRQQTKYLAGVIAMLVLIAGAFVLERAIVTPRERVKEAVYGITSAFQAKDLDGVLQYVSEQNTDLVLLIHSAYNVISLGDDMRVTDVQVDLSNEETLARSRFRVNATVSIKPPAASSGFQHWEPTRWEAKWQLEGDQWRMVDIIELDRLTGRPTGRIDPLRHFAKKRYQNRDEAPAPSPP